MGFLMKLPFILYTLQSTLKSFRLEEQYCALQYEMDYIYRHSEGEEFDKLFGLLKESHHFDENIERRKILFSGDKPH